MDWAAGETDQRANHHEAPSDVPNTEHSCWMGDAQRAYTALRDDLVVDLEKRTGTCCVRDMQLQRCQPAQNPMRSLDGRPPNNKIRSRDIKQDGSHRYKKICRSELEKRTPTCCVRAMQLQRAAPGNARRSESSASIRPHRPAECPLSEHHPGRIRDTCVCVCVFVNTRVW